MERGVFYRLFWEESRSFRHPEVCWGIFVIVVPRKLGNSFPLQMQALPMPPKKSSMRSSCYSQPTWEFFSLPWKSLLGLHLFRVSTQNFWAGRLLGQVHLYHKRMPPNVKSQGRLPRSSHSSADTFWNNESSPAGATLTNSQSGRRTCLGRKRTRGPG